MPKNHGLHSVFLTSNIVNFFAKLSDQWERANRGPSGSSKLAGGFAALCLLLLFAAVATTESGESNQAQGNGGGNDAIVVQNRELSEKMSDAWKTVWSRYYDPKTSQFFTTEAARLPMFCATAWDVGRNQEHYRMYRKYLPQAIEQSIKLPHLPQAEISRWIPPYALLQMQCSLEVLHDLERDPEMKSQIGEAMRRVAEFAAQKRAFTARKRNPNDRELGETALAQLTFRDLTFTQQQKAELAGAIMNARYAVDPSAAYCLLGAYWKARVRGYFQP